MSDPYRDGRMPCPECGVELTRYEGRDKWRCMSCAGALLGQAELQIELPAQDAVSERPRACPMCKTEMRAVQLGDLMLDRCARDGLVWFDRGELGKLRTALAEEPEGWIQRWAAVVRNAL